MGSAEYVTLMASLPALGPILAAKHPPINRERLHARLALLRPEHRDEVRAATQLLAWSGIDLGHGDAALVRDARRLVRQLSEPTLVTALRDRMEMRTLVAALRRRQAGQGAPPPGALWGYGRYVTRIRENWSQPDFAVSAAFPWVLRAREKLEKEDAAGLERILLEEVWRHAAWLAAGHDFDHVAVALYLVRWQLLDRWTRYDAEAAAARFGALVDQALAAAPEFFLTEASA